MQRFQSVITRLHAFFRPSDFGGGGDPVETRLSYPSVSIVVVCFNSAEPLNSLLAGLRKSECLLNPIEIILVNNSCDDADEIKRIAAQYGCRVIQNSENLGYGTACNRGARVAESNLVLFLNPDVTLSKASINLLAGASLLVSDGVAFGPVIYDEGRRRHSKTISIADPGAAASKMNAPRNGLVPTAFISGCAFMVKRDAFLRIGGFDESIFLYYEDDDICIRLRQFGTLHIVESAVALHSHGRSANDPRKWRKLRAQNLGYSMAYVLAKHRGTSGIALAIAKTILRCLSPLNLLSDRHRPPQADRGCRHRSCQRLA